MPSAIRFLFLSLLIVFSSNSLRMSSDILFATIEKIHYTSLSSSSSGGSSSSSSSSGSNASWGRVLDAGTGAHSLKWLQTLNTESIVAITADNGMKNTILNDKSVKPLREGKDEVLVGNWMDFEFESSLQKYDVILADYLIGAVDGFSPYEQDVILEKLRNHLLPNGKLYIIGMNPIPDYSTAPLSLSPALLITEIKSARDSCILLAGHRPYREFPIEWMKRHLEKSRLRITKIKNFTILHSVESSIRQIKVAQSKLPLIKNTALRSGLEVYLDDLTNRVKTAINAAPAKNIPLSFDYVIACEIDDVPTTVFSNLST